MNPARLECQRDRFSLPAGVHFLNCAYLGPLPRAVAEAGAAGILRKSLPIDVPSDEFFEDCDRVRDRFARLVGLAEPNRIAILPSVSYGMAIVARNAPAARGDNLVLIDQQFPSNVYAMRRLAQRTGAELRTVRRPAGGPPRAAAWNQAILESIDRQTAVVTLPHVHWTDGTRLDLESIGRRARDVGATFVVDGSQSVGALPFDVDRIRPDALVCAGYKWLLGPYSLALGYFGPAFDDGEPLEETWIARRGSRDFQGLVDYQDAYEPGALRYDVGERSNFILIPMMRAALDLLLEWRPERIQDYCGELLADLEAFVEERELEIEPATGRASHMLGIRLPDLDLAQLQQRLVEAAVHASLRGDALRVSPNVYNSADDIDALVTVLSQTG